MSFHPKMAYGAAFHKSARELEDEGPPFVYTPERRARFSAVYSNGGPSSSSWRDDLWKVAPYAIGG